jgi:hypothetical protein
MPTIANGSGGLIPTKSTTIVPFSSADRRRKIAPINVVTAIDSRLTTSV